jgi:hypothetical protein
VLLLVVLVLAVVVGLVLRSRVEAVPPFDVDSSRPEGLRAVRLLLEERGVAVDRAPSSGLLDGSVTPGPGDAVVMMAPSVADPDEVEAAEQLAGDGVLVVFGEPPADVADDGLRYSAVDEAAMLGGRALADERPLPVSPGTCDIAELEGLGDIDAAFAWAVSLPGDQQCYSEEGGAHFWRSGRGPGSVVTLSSPFLWANARLQPRKEEGGPPLANGATAIRILGSADRVTFIDPVPSPGATPSGDQDPIALMPLPVKLALAQLLGAFVLFVWWRSRRLGPPVAERMPVEVAGSELVGAVGDLMRRRGNAERAAASVRADTRRVLAERLGLGHEPDPRALVAVVAERTGRDPDQVGSALYGDPAAPVSGSDALVASLRTLDTIRQEVLHVDAR